MPSCEVIASPGIARSTRNTTTATPTSVSAVPSNLLTTQLALIDESARRGLREGDEGPVGTRVEAPHTLLHQVVVVAAEEPHPRRLLEQLLLQLPVRRPARRLVVGGVALGEQRRQLRRVEAGGTGQAAVLGEIAPVHQVRVVAAAVERDGRVEVRVEPGRHERLGGELVELERDADLLQ